MAEATAQAVRITAGGPVLHAVLARPGSGNSIDDSVLDGLSAALDAAERSEQCRMVVISAEGDRFCTGMDMVQAARETAPDGGTDRGQDGRLDGRPDGGSDGGSDGDRGGGQDGGSAFFRLLRRITTCPRMVVATVDGQVSGGGVGLVAACDVVHVTPRAGFGLPEALWGLLPCSVLPFLIRRTGFQRASVMTLSTLPLTAEQALSCGLADELSDDPAAFVRRLRSRAVRLNGTVLGDAKRYLSRLAPLTAETEDLAVREFTRLLNTPEVRGGIAGFVQDGRYPWQR